MNPNAMRVLERNGLADEVRRDSWPYLTRETRDRSGRLLATRDYRPLYDERQARAGRAGASRAPARRALPQPAAGNGALRGDGQPTRDSVEADLVVGADGIHSQVRRELFRRRRRPALHGLPLAPPDHGQRRRRALLHRVPRARPAHRPGADLARSALRLDHLQLAARDEPRPARPSAAVRAVHRRARCSACSPRCRRRKHHHHRDRGAVGRGLDPCGATAPCCSATRCTP